MIVKALKVLGITLIALVLLFVFAANFSEVETRYKCEATITSEHGSQKETIYLKLSEYRWWVGLWSDSDGMLMLESTDGFMSLFTQLEDNGEKLFIFDDEKRVVGSYSKLSGNLDLDTSRGYIEGPCLEISN